MDGDRNPDLSRIPSAVKVGVPPPIQTAVSVEGISSESHLSVMVVETATSSPSKKKKKGCLPETLETQNLSTAELQRLVLLEQFEVLRLKKRKLMRELKENEPEKELVTEHDNPVYTVINYPTVL
ncbi:unnamed protein product [Acanthoscelides obtectus]|uniref:Uncharacterized protein n=1 Tax=Acanthoscelides obtectus TaxID=200917 RepID=A0A9P0NSU8_ACAOB|nr:unnamed protein product [Acanthoscelides obtectus]CAK1678439.1 hypothetical protein AOBTE_LOCUS31906 [Acanthoscelides obtectus]